MLDCYADMMLADTSMSVLIFFTIRFQLLDICCMMETGNPYSRKEFFMIIQFIRYR